MTTTSTTQNLIAVVLALAAGACTADAGTGKAGGGGSGGKPQNDGTLDPSLDPPAGACEGQAAAFADTPLRRLTRSQYRETVRVVLGVDDPDIAAALPEDERTGPFPGNTKQPVSDVHVRRYADAAEALAAKATATLDALLGCAPTDACVEGFIPRFATRAFRRSPTEQERTTLLKLYRDERVHGAIRDAVELVITAVLQSPQFLYHVESKPAVAGAAKNVVVPLAPHELAARLSYFFWNAPPDDVLIDAAQSGKLDTQEGVRAQAARLLEDERARAFATQFGLHWFDLTHLERVTKDPRRFLRFGAEVRTAMQHEAEGFFDHVLRRGDGSLETLLTASYSFVSKPLLPIYGLAAGGDADPTKPIALTPGQRSGALTLPGVLAVHAGAEDTSPVKRGVFIFKNLLCQEIALPPIEIPPLPEPQPGQSNRERFAVHTSNVACASCHTVIDPIGFGFENYDAIGAYRTQDDGKPIDARGELRIDNDAVDGPFDGAVELGRKLVAAKELHACVPIQMLRYALGRAATEADACGLADLRRGFIDSELNVRDLALALASSDAFRLRPTQPSQP